MADRLEVLAYRGEWPARLRRALGLSSSVAVGQHRVEIGGSWNAAKPLKIGFAADFHAGPTTDAEMLRHACDALSAAGPDLLLLGGDFVSLHAKEIDWLAPLLGAIPAPLGRYAVLGNHDYWNGPREVVDALEQAGIEVLTNRNRRLAEPFDDVWVCGLDDFISGAPDPRQALAGAEGTRIVLMHAPANLVDLEGQRFDLALCGHTHGGQVALPGGRPLLVAPGPFSRRYNRGRFDLATGGTLLVSVGLGCSTLPLRLNAKPEVLIVSVAAAERRSVIPGPG